MTVPRFALLLAVALLALASARPHTAGADDAHLAAAAARLEQGLIAPCCFHQTVADHRSPESDAVREEIRRRLAAGESEAAILAYYETRYGERILAAPHARGFGLVAWLTPAAVLSVAGVGVWRWLRRHRRGGPGRDDAPPPAAPPGDDALDARLAAELARFDG